MDNKQKVIITIGRQIGSGGSAVAEMLAKEFGARLYDSQILNLAARESGFSEEFFAENDEKKGFFKTALQFNFPLFARNSYYDNNEFTQEKLYLFQCDAIRKAAEEGSCVFVGRTADYVLRDMDNVVNVFLTADIELRVAEVARRRGISADEARKYITEGESKRSSYYNYYTGKRWGHSESYDLCINAGRIGNLSTVKMIASYVRQVTHQDSNNNE